MSGHIAALGDSVTRKKVVYKNRYGMDITGELYHSKDLDMTQKHPTLIVGAPYGGVKEQGPCVYGNELAQRWVDAENGYPEYLPGFPEKPIEEVPADIPEPDAEWMRFYAVKRDHHLNAHGGFITTSALTMMNYPLLAHIDEIPPAYPVCGWRPGTLQVFQRERLCRRAGTEGTIRGN